MDLDPCSSPPVQPSAEFVETCSYMLDTALCQMMEARSPATSTESNGGSNRLPEGIRATMFVRTTESFHSGRLVLRRYVHWGPAHADASGRASMERDRETGVVVLEGMAEDQLVRAGSAWPASLPCPWHPSPSVVNPRFGSRQLFSLEAAAWSCRWPTRRPCWGSWLLKGRLTAPRRETGTLSAETAGLPSRYVRLCPSCSAGAPPLLDRCLLVPATATAAQERGSLARLQRALASACVMDQRTAVVSRSNADRQRALRGIVQEAQGTLNTMRTLNMFLKPRAKDAADKDLVQGISIQGDRLNDVLQQLQEALYGPPPVPAFAAARPTRPLLLGAGQPAQQQPKQAALPAPAASGSLGAAVARSSSPPGVPQLEYRVSARCHHLVQESQSRMIDSVDMAGYLLRGRGSGAAAILGTVDGGGSGCSSGCRSASSIRSRTGLGRRRCRPSCGHQPDRAVPHTRPHHRFIAAADRQERHSAPHRRQSRGRMGSGSDQ